MSGVSSSKLKTNQDKCGILRKKLEREKYEPNDLHEIIASMYITKKAQGVKKNIVKRKREHFKILRLYRLSIK